MIISTAPFVAGFRVAETKGQVFGLVVRSRGLGGNLMAGLRSIGGGEIHEYTSLLEDTRRQAIDRMVQNATLVGANAVISMRFDSSELAGTMSEIVAYGTAVVIAPDAGAPPGHRVAPMGVDARPRPDRWARRRPRRRRPRGRGGGTGRERRLVPVPDPAGRDPDRRGRLRAAPLPLAARPTDPATTTGRAAASRRRPSPGSGPPTSGSSTRRPGSRCASSSTRRPANGGTSPRADEGR